jgi:bifunctional non-homologous end joining protein LigD
MKALLLLWSRIPSGVDQTRSIRSGRLAGFHRAVYGIRHCDAVDRRIRPTVYAVVPDDTASNGVIVGGRELTMSNLEKVLYPATGFTKGQMIDYYTKVSRVMLPHLRDRPLTMKRCPDGVDQPSFFEKHAPVHTPEWMRKVSVPSTADGDAVEYLMVCDLPTLIWAVNLATVEFHVPLWRVPMRSTVPGPPDHLVFDLDPGEGVTIVECCSVATHVARILTDQGLECIAKTSGFKGLHLYSPLRDRPSWNLAREHARKIAMDLEREVPDLVVSNMRKGHRRGKVLIDWSQNHPAKTTVAAYSLRARSEPTVSTPVTWEEVERCHQSGDPASLRFTAPEVLDRIDSYGDLFASA